MDLWILSIIAVIALANLITRFLVYFIAPREIPNFLIFISKALPSVIIALLVVYCLKDSRDFIKESISIGLILILHLSFKIPILSVFGGVCCYMLLIQKFNL